MSEDEFDVLLRASRALLTRIERLERDARRATDNEKAHVDKIASLSRRVEELEKDGSRLRKRMRELEGASA